VNKTEINNFEAIKRGDIKSFEILFRAYYKPLLIYSERIVENKEDADEVVQDIFYKLWEKRKTLEITTSINSYLYKSTYNNSLQLLKRRKLDLKYQKYKIHQEEQKTINPNEEMIATELSHKIGQLLEALPDNCKKIFKLNRYKGMKYQEIADMLSISIKTVEANMTKALKHFRENLKEYTVLEGERR
jgi:RNA polymerase sigma-70 factor (ECF subfamily)